MAVIRYYIQPLEYYCYRVICSPLLFTWDATPIPHRSIHTESGGVGHSSWYYWLCIINDHFRSSFFTII